MREMRGVIYRDYTVVVNPTGAPAGKCRDTFSVHKHVEGVPDMRISVYQRPISKATEFSTEQEAIDEAMKHAGAWIDAQYR